jgi:hypothetical protein
LLRIPPHWRQVPQYFHLQVRKGVINCKITNVCLRLPIPTCCCYCCAHCGCCEFFGTHTLFSLMRPWALTYPF